ncbi:MAG TPA: GTP-binding protein [Opitutaceae bacterium]
MLGPVHAGRRNLVADLIEGGLSEGEKAGVILSEGEPAADPDARLAELSAVSRWKWVAAGILAAEPPTGVSHIFFVSSGLTDPIDQIEAFKTWLAAQRLELARTICVVDCKLAEAHPQMLAWFDGCIHFSDVVLLNRREGVANKWMSDFQERYRSQAYPCVFEMVRDDKVKNPALILEPRALRISHVFDEELDWTVVGKSDDDETSEGEEEVEVALEEDPYFARLNGGRRIKELPDIRKYRTG